MRPELPEAYDKPHGAWSTPHQREVYNERVMRVNAARAERLAAKLSLGMRVTRDDFLGVRMEWYRAASGNKYDPEALAASNRDLGWVNGKDWWGSDE